MKKQLDDTMDVLFGLVAIICVYFVPWIVIGLVVLSLIK